MKGRTGIRSVTDARTLKPGLAAGLVLVYILQPPSPLSSPPGNFSAALSKEQQMQRDQLQMSFFPPES